MRTHRVMMEVIVDVDAALHEQAIAAMLSSLQDHVNHNILLWQRPIFISKEEVRIRTTGWF